MAITTCEYILRAASNWDISASNVLTNSKTSGVLTNRTNLETTSANQINRWIQAIHRYRAENVSAGIKYNLSIVPFVNQVSALSRLPTSSLIDWTSLATCSSATFKWVTNGFTNPEASFSVCPSLDTNNSHLPKQKPNKY